MNIDRIEQEISETEALLEAMIFIAENADCRQFAGRVAVTLGWIARDKLRRAQAELSDAHQTP